MKTRALLPLLFLGALAAAGLSNRWHITTLRQENESLARRHAEASQLASESDRTSSGEGFGHRLSPAEQAEVARLRTEVAELRLRKAEVDRLRADNIRMGEQARAAAHPAALSRDFPGFISRKAWTNAGLATPEAAMQSFFWAVREHNYEELMRCLSPEMSQGFSALFEGVGPQGREEVWEKKFGNFRIPAFTIAERAEPGEDRVILGLQAIPGGATQKMTLRRFGTEWKLVDEK